MKRKRNFYILFFGGLFSFALFIFISIAFSPVQTISILNLQISIIPFFLFLIFSFLFTLGSTIFRSTLQGLLISFVSLSYVLLRLFHLTHWFFVVLLLLLFGIAELSLWQKQ